jgi:lipoprotein-releasing system permease protein
VSQRGLKRLFLLVGVLIGAAGAAVGSLTAFGLSVLQQRYALIPLPADAYYMTTAPIQLNMLDYLLVNGIAILLCAIAAYIPARVAARIEPVRAIRFQ